MEKGEGRRGRDYVARDGKKTSSNEAPRLFKVTQLGATVLSLNIGCLHPQQNVQTCPVTALCRLVVNSGGSGSPLTLRDVPALAEQNV